MATSKAKQQKQTPHYPIDEVKRLVAAKMVRWRQTRAINFLVERFAKKWKDHGYAILAALDESCYAGRVEQRFDDVFDVYAVLYDGIYWYVKIKIESEMQDQEAQQVQEIVMTISCHPLEHPIKTNQGEVKNI